MQVETNEIIDDESKIVPDVSSLFEEFRGKRMSLLHRGSRDGFGSRDFHKHCDSKKDTITIIQTTKNDIIGGYTPVAWDSRKGYKADDTLKSFIFILQNPSNINPTIFHLIPSRKHCAIWCDSGDGPCFGANEFSDIYVSDNCNTSTCSDMIHFGTSYSNDTKHSKIPFFNGEKNFTVKEIEVFQITEPSSFTLPSEVRNDSQKQTGTEQDEGEEQCKQEEQRKQEQLAISRANLSLTHICPYGCGRPIPNEFYGCTELLNVHPNWFN
jgi:hypothetical protein